MSGKLPEWDLGSEYMSLDSDEFRIDNDRVETLIRKLESLSSDIASCLDDVEALDPETETDLLSIVVDAAETADSAEILVSNISVYANCLLSVDGTDTAAREAKGRAEVLSSRLECAKEPLSLLLALCSDAFFLAFAATQTGKSWKFLVGQERKYSWKRLSLEEERLLSVMRVSGFSSWGNLYDSICARLECVVETDGGIETLGFAEAQGRLKLADASIRKSSYESIHRAFASQEESCAAILNSISRWRLDEYSERSRERKVHFLDEALGANRMRKETLDALMEAVDDSTEIGRKALRAQALLYGQKRLGPWDILAPLPARHVGEGKKEYSFDEGIALVRDAYAGVHPDMGSFVERALRQGWIETRVLKAKRPGAYCTRFLKSGTPRVYMTYSGTLNDVFTLAHELGHAFHNHILSDLHPKQRQYTMVLAETASTFAETVLQDRMLSRAGSDAERLAIEWSNAQDAATFLLNIPARYEFEKNFYELRKTKVVSPSILKSLMRDAWGKYYGESLSGYDDMFWCTKLHFHKTGTSFYNFPYTFGWLFSLGIFSRAGKDADSFYGNYLSILRDTGVMEAEDLVSKHLGEDIARKEFWLESIAVSGRAVDRFVSLAEKVASGPK